MASEDTGFPLSLHPILHVGDEAFVLGSGWRKVAKITVCLTPTTDPAGETNFAEVEAVEVGEHGPMYVVVTEGGAWAYGIEITHVRAAREEGKS